MLCVGPSHLDWNWQGDGVGKCFRHFGCNIPTPISSETATAIFIIIHFGGTSSDRDSGPSAPMALLPHAQDWRQQVTRWNRRELMLCVGMAVVFGSLTLEITFYNSIAISRLILSFNCQIPWSCSSSSQMSLLFCVRRTPGSQPWTVSWQPGAWLILIDIFESRSLQDS